MNIKNFFILLVGLITTYISLESASKQERSPSGGTFFYIKSPFLRHELEERQKTERRQKSEIENKEKQRIVAQKVRAHKQSKRQEKEIQRKAHQQYKNKTDIYENSFMESIPDLK